MGKINFRLNNIGECRKCDKEKRTMTFVASDSTRDAYNTVLLPENWDLERFNKNGVIGYQHNVYGSSFTGPNPDDVIGKGHAYIEDEKLFVDVEFEPKDLNEQADKIFKKLQFGSLKGVSVGFIPKGKGAFGKGKEGAGQENETYYYGGQELVEISVVNIPANPNALKKDAKEEEDEEIKSQRDADLKAAQKIEEPKEEPKIENPETDNKKGDETAETDTLGLAIALSEAEMEL